MATFTRIPATDRFVASFALLVLLLAGSAAIAQPVGDPSPAPAASPATDVPTPAPPAGVIPGNITLDVTGAPVTDPDVLNTQIRTALDRRIRPTLRPGSGVHYGPIVPWPLPPLVTGTRAAANVTVAITGDGVGSAAVTGVTTVTLNSVDTVSPSPHVLYLSDDPEYLLSEGLVFRGDVTAARPARLYYYHSDIGLPRDVDVVLTATAAARVHLIASAAGPDLDVMSVGHAVSRDFVRFRQGNQGVVVDVDPAKPLVVRHSLVLQGEVVAGAIDVHVVSGGAVTISVVASLAGSRPETYLGGPRVAFDGRRRHGTFNLDGFGTLTQTYTVGGPDVAVKYGARTPTPENLDPSDSGRDLGDYGVAHRITFTLVNPTDAPHVVYLYEKPLGGPVRSSFLVDGQVKEVGCVRLPQAYAVTAYQLPAQSTSASTTITMTDGGSFYPLEFGVTETQPLPNAPAVGTADGCSPRIAVPVNPAEALSRR